MKYNFEEKYLFQAKKMADYVIQSFWDTAEKLFYFTDNNDEQLIARKKEIFDNVIPSSNAMMASCLYWLGRCFADSKYRELAEDLIFKLKPLTLKDPRWLSHWAKLGILMTSSEIEITFVGKQAKHFAKMLHSKFRNPNALFFVSESSSNLPVFDGREFEENKMKIYVCVNKTCQLPVGTVEEAIELLK